MNKILPESPAANAVLVLGIGAIIGIGLWIFGIPSMIIIPKFVIQICLGGPQ